MSVVKWVPKGFPPFSDGRDAPRDKGWNVLDGSALLPLMTLRLSALRNNVLAMARYCSREGVDLAPHGKTTMSPQLFNMQREAGAWAITAATVWQVGAMRQMACPRILLANVMVDAAGIQFVANEIANDPSFDFYCYADSVASVELMNTVLSECAPPRPIQVLVELGQRGGRTGVRSPEDAVRVADAVSTAQSLELCGVAGFEGLIKGRDSSDQLEEVGDFLRRMRAVTEELDEAGAFDHRHEVIVSAGGSAYFDRVVDILTGFKLSKPVRTVLRSGGYISHDATMYERTSPLAMRRADGEELRLVPALELWSTVWSRPEPGLAVLGFGKRDSSFDYGLPVPLRVYANGRGVERHLSPESTIFELNDQHAFLRLALDEDVKPGDTVVCGISHPCTAFDSWRSIPLVTDSFDVCGSIETYF